MKAKRKRPICAGCYNSPTERHTHRQPKVNVRPEDAPASIAPVPSNSLYDVLNIEFQDHEPSRIVAERLVSVAHQYRMCDGAMCDHFSERSLSPSGWELALALLASIHPAYVRLASAEDGRTV